MPHRGQHFRIDYRSNGGYRGFPLVTGRMPPAEVIAEPCLLEFVLAQLLPQVSRLSDFELSKFENGNGKWPEDKQSASQLKVASQRFGPLVPFSIISGGATFMKGLFMPCDIADKTGKEFWLPNPDAVHRAYILAWNLYRLRMEEAVVGTTIHINGIDMTLRPYNVASAQH